MCRDFDRIDDRFSPPQGASSPHDMFMQDMFRVAQHARKFAKEEQDFWANKRGDFKLNGDQSQIDWADLAPISSRQPETAKASYPWNTESTDWTKLLPDSFTFLKRGVDEAIAQALQTNDVESRKPPKVEVPASVTTEAPVATRTETPTATETPVVTRTETPTATQTEAPVLTSTETPVLTSEAPQAPVKTETPVKSETQKETIETPQSSKAEDKPEVAKSGETHIAEDTSEPMTPVIRDGKGEKVSDLRYTSYSPPDRVTTVMGDMRDLGREISNPTPPEVIYEKTALDAYKKGLAEKKPVVLIIGEDWCQWCKALEKELEKPEFKKYGGSAIFAKVQPSKDNSAKAIADALEIKNYPAITILEPNAAMIEERGRIVGYMDAAKLDTHLAKLLTSQAQNQMERKPVSIVAEA